MINSIAKLKPVAPANGHRSGLAGDFSDVLDAARRGQPRTTHTFITATHGGWAGW